MRTSSGRTAADRLRRIGATRYSALVRRLHLIMPCSRLGMTSSSFAERYRRFVASGRNASYNPWEQVVGQIFLGGEVFCERMQVLIDSEVVPTRRWPGRS